MCERLLARRLAARVASGGGNAAVVVAVARHHNVAVQAPRRRPRVFDEVVVRALVSAIADSQHTVVELARRALRLIVHTTRVKLQRAMFVLIVVATDIYKPNKQTWNDW
jgi:hypothetical protein